VKDIIEELRTRGKTIIMSTHQMHQVEALCNRILLISAGRNVLYGDVARIKRDFAGNVIEIEGHGDFEHLTGVLECRRHNSAWSLTLKPGVDPQSVLREIMRQEGVMLERFELAEPSLEDIFVTVVQGQAQEQPREE
jgi:ABC-2 type transport system ATP-binding protein